MRGENQEWLLVHGLKRSLEFCQTSGFAMPEAKVVPKDEWRFDACAYYREDTGIRICLERCARPGMFGRAWSWPGYVVDRTPYGVIAHELGHAVDMCLSQETDRYRGDYSKTLRRATSEDPITSYCPDDGEWFAEIFRLFVTNPDLLAAIRPKIYGALRAQFERWAQIKHQLWRDVLATNEAPERTLKAATNKVRQAQHARGEPSEPRLL